jgi:hypothetical protein
MDAELARNQKQKKAYFLLILLAVIYHLIHSING